MAAASFLIPPSDPGVLPSNPVPAADYQEALVRMDRLRAREGRNIVPECRLQFLTHGGRVPRCVVFLHGLSSCPKQFQELGGLLYERGYNVLAAPMPHHGSPSLPIAHQARLTAEDLTAFADEVLDIARGTGEHVTVVGLSMGGVVAGWVAQHRSDVDRVVLISPSFGLRLVPRCLANLFTGLCLRLPNFFWWWDPLRRARWYGPKHVNPRFASRALGEIFRLGAAIKAEAVRRGPAARSIVMVTNAGDPSLDNAATAAIVETWRNQGGRSIETFEFEAKLRLVHDLIDPEQPGQRTEVVYPILVKLIEGERPAGSV